MSKNAKLIIAVLMIIVLFAAGLVYYFTVNDKENNTKALDESLFPQTLMGLSLAQVVSGPQAIGMISELHGSNITIKQGYIASYHGNQAQIMIWVSESNNENEAVKLFEIMDQKISSPSKNGSGQPPFTGRRNLEVNGINVIAVKGMGMENYYYQIKNKVYWIAAGGVDPLKTLETVMKSI